LAIHNPFVVAPEPPDEDDELPDEDDEPPEEDDEPPDEDDEPPEEDDELPDEDDVAPDEDDDVAEAIGVYVVLLPPPQPASRPLTTTATDMTLSPSYRLGLMTENGFMASPVRFVCTHCSRLLKAVSASADTVYFQPIQLADALA
jgi:hypothetical protein